MAREGLIHIYRKWWLGRGTNFSRLSRFGLLRLLAKIRLLTLVLLFTVSCDGPQLNFSSIPIVQGFQQNDSNSDLVFGRAKVDILWVIDNSGSMQTSQQNLAANMSVFIDEFMNRGIDFQMGVTTTDSYEAEPQFNNDPEDSQVPIVNPRTPNLRDVFLEHILQGIDGSGDERAFLSLRSALSNPLNASFYRRDSFLAVIILSDEDDFSHDGVDPIFNNNSSSLHSVQSYLDYLTALTSSTADLKNFNVSSVAIFDSACRDQLDDGFGTQIIGERYGAITDATFGIRASICGNFADELRRISNNIISLVARFDLKKVPVDGAEIVVYVNNEVVVEIDPVADPLASGWSYSAASNSILFHNGAIPPAGAMIKVVYFG